MRIDILMMMMMAIMMMPGSDAVRFPVDDGVYDGYWAYDYVAICSVPLLRTLGLAVLELFASAQSSYCNNYSCC